MPTDEQLIEFAILCLEGKLDADRIADMLAMTKVVVDRLYENGDITKAASDENE